MKVSIEKFDGSRIVKNMPNVGEESTMILVPRRSLLDIDEIYDWMRFDKTAEYHEGLPLFCQSDKPCEFKVNSQVIIIASRDSEESIGEIKRL